MKGNIGAVILLGGKSSRMDYNDKFLLKYENETFLNRIKSSLDGMPIFYSLHKNDKFVDCKLKGVEYKKDDLIFDNYGDIGPIGAILSAFEKTSYDYLFIVSSDIPRGTSELVHFMLGKLYMINRKVSEFKEKSIIVKDEKLNPCFAIYHKNVIPILKENIQNKNYRLQDFIKQINYEEVDISNTVFKRSLYNVNTYEDYFRLTKPFIFCISGYKNSGKTTLICELLKYFQEDNYKVCVLKHDGHDFKTDIENTDTYKYNACGCKDVTIYSSTKHMSIIDGDFLIDNYISSKKDYDFVIIEGLKASNFPKIQMIEDIKEFESINSSESQVIENVFLKVKKEKDLNDLNVYKIYNKIIKEAYAR